MNLLYCIPSLYNAGGLEKILSLKVNYLIEKFDYNITIVTTEQFEKNYYFELNPNVTIINLDIGKNRKYNNILKNIISYFKINYEYENKLKKILLDNHFDICISLGSELYFINNINDQSAKIFEYHFTAQKLQNQPKVNILKRLWRKYLNFRFIIEAKKLKKFIVLTEDDFLFWKTYLKNVIVINNPNTTVQIDTSSNSNCNSVVSLGRLSYEKGYDRLIKIWSDIINKHNKKWILNIYGAGIQKPKLLGLIHDLGLEDNIKIHNPQKDIAEIFAKNCIYLNTSYYEGFPLTFLEAMTYKLPIVAFDSKGGINELLKNNVNGYKIEYGDHDEFVEKVIKLMEDQSLREKFGLTGFDMSKKYDIDKIMLRWVELFKTITSK